MDTAQLKQMADLSKLPFIKQKRYRDEAEYRILFESKVVRTVVPRVSIDASCINRITLSPWMHSSIKDSLVKALRQIEGAEKINIQRSTLISSSHWEKFATEFSES